MREAQFDPLAALPASIRGSKTISLDCTSSGGAQSVNAESVVPDASASDLWLSVALLQVRVALRPHSSRNRELDSHQRPTAPAAKRPFLMVARSGSERPQVAPRERPLPARSSLSGDAGRLRSSWFDEVSRFKSPISGGNWQSAGEIRRETRFHGNACEASSACRSCSRGHVKNAWLNCGSRGSGMARLP
jgi:hypothetical protein